MRATSCSARSRHGWRAPASGPLDPLASVDWRKRRRLRWMAREWLAGRADGGPHPPELRFDAIGITLDPAGALLALEHVEEAF